MADLEKQRKQQEEKVEEERKKFVKLKKKIEMLKSQNEKVSFLLSFETTRRRLTMLNNSRMLQLDTEKSVTPKVKKDRKDKKAKKDKKDKMKKKESITA